jgi:hypothetical protein
VTLALQFLSTQTERDSCENFQNRFSSDQHDGCGSMQLIKQQEQGVQPSGIACIPGCTRRQRFG